MSSECKYDIEQFIVDIGLPVEDVACLYAELIKEFNSNIIELKKLYKKKDFDSIKKVVHNLKGISINYRVEDIYNKTVKIYSDLKNSCYDNLASDINDLSSIYEAAEKEIQRYFLQKDCELYGIPE